jgi:hypothetical protein
MKTTLKLLSLSLCALLFGCGYSTITGLVIDAETKQPIEGAIALVEYQKIHGFGFTYTLTDKVYEVLSDKDGKVELPGTMDPYVQHPIVTVYKAGYVAWNSKFIFPIGYTKRTDFAWKDRYVFRLERFRPEYSYNDHASFISNSYPSNDKINMIEQFLSATEWERYKATEEMNKTIKQKYSKGL